MSAENVRLADQILRDLRELNAEIRALGRALDKRDFRRAALARKGDAA